MAHQAAGSSSSATLCTICLEEVSDNCDRTLVKLKCSHEFHLDCIGSAFNATGVMQCPNCREIEKGVWRRFEETTPRQSMHLNSDDDDRQLTEMQEEPSEFHNCPVHGRGPPSGYRTMIREFDLTDGYPNFSRHSFSLHPNPATYTAEDSHNHQHNWANPLSSHATIPDPFFSANRAPVPYVNITTGAPGGAHRSRRRESVARLTVSRLGGSGVPVHNNFERNGAPSSNSPSPRVPTPYEQPNNDFPGWPAADNRAPPAEPPVASYRVPPSSVPSQNQPQLGNLVHGDVQGGGNVPPSGSHPGGIDPSSLLRDS